MSEQGGSLMPVTVSTDPPIGGPALPVVGYTSLPAGRVAQGGAALPVYVVSDAEVAAGRRVLGGTPVPMVLASAVGQSVTLGQRPVPVYVVSGSLGAPAYLSGEIGDVDDTTVAIVFTAPLTSPGGDYALGVTIEVNGSPATINSATLQLDQVTVLYVLSAPVVAGDAVTWAYDSGVGDLEGLTGDPVATIAAQPVTNNVPGLLAGQPIGLLLALTYA